MELNAKQFTMVIASLIVGIVLIVGILTPICAEASSQSSETVENEGAGWVRFALDRNANTTYSLSYSEDDDASYMDNGTDRQTYVWDDDASDFDTIFYADSNLSVWSDEYGSHILGTKDGNPIYAEDFIEFTIIRDASGVTITPDTSEPLTFGVPTWAYIPVSTGNYGFFLASDLDSESGNGVKNYPSDMPLAVVGGGFAGVYAYNDAYRFNGLGFTMQSIIDEDGLYYGATWERSTASGDVQSVDSIVLNLADPAQTYTDGEWVYELGDVNGVQKAAIVSYTGTGGDVVVPATVGGYDVYRLGKTAVSGQEQNPVFDSSTLSAGSTLTISNGIVEIGAFAVFHANFIGSLVIPDSVTSIGLNAFSSAFTISQGTHELFIPDSVTYIGDGAFHVTTAQNVIIVSDAIPGTGAFESNLIHEVLDLSNTVDYSVDRYGIPSSATVSDSIGDCFGFISVVEYTTGGDPTPTQMLIAVLPLLMVVGLIVGCIGYLKVKS